MNNNPFDCNNEGGYRDWRQQKLEAWQNQRPEVIEIADPGSITADEYQALSDQMRQLNMALFRLPGEPAISSEILKKIGAQFGLTRLDSNLYANDSDVSELRVIDKGRRGEYIPYTNRSLGWHTDGYYNQPDHVIRSFILYCVANAAEGGFNQLLDPELAYIHIRDHGTQYIEALMQPDAFSIPETIENGTTVRPEQQNPVFQIDPQTGHLLMRYTRRKTHINWRQDEATQTALSLMGDLLDSDSAHILQFKLSPGEGLICNNVLHNRSAFTDDPEHPRIMLRARYYDRFRELENA